MITGSETAHLAARIGPLFLEGRLPVLPAKDAAALGLREDQIVRMVAEVRNEQVKLILQGRLFDPPPQANVKPGDTVAMKVQILPNGNATLRPIEIYPASTNAAKASAVGGASSPAPPVSVQIPAREASQLNLQSGSIVRPSVTVQGGQLKLLLQGKVFDAPAQMKVSQGESVPFRVQILPSGTAVLTPMDPAVRTNMPQQPASSASSGPAIAPAPTATRVATPLTTPLATPLTTPLAAPLTTPLAAPLTTPLAAPVTTPLATPLATPAPAAAPASAPIAATPLPAPTAAAPQVPQASLPIDLALKSQFPRLDRLALHPPGAEALISLLKPAGLEQLLPMAAMASPEISKLLQYIFRMRPAMDQMSAQDVRQSIQQSGFFTESALAKGLGQQAIDLKSILRLIVQRLQGQHQEAAGKISRAIDDIESLQIKALESSLPREQGLHAMLAFSNAPPVDIRITREPARQDQQERPWVVNLYSQTEEWGELWLQTRVFSQGKIDLAMWAAREDIFISAQNRSGQLREAIAQAGLELKELEVFYGKRPASAADAQNAGSAEHIDLEA